MLRIIWIACCIAFISNKAIAQQDPSEQVNQLISAEYNLSVLATKKGLLTAYQTFSDENTIFYTPAPTKVTDYLKNKPNLPDVMQWKPIYAKVAKSDEWGFTTGAITWQKVGSPKKYGEYLCLWKRDRKGEWRMAYRAISEHFEPYRKISVDFESPANNKYRKSRSRARLKQREDIILSTDQLYATILKADNKTAFKEFLTDGARIYIPGYNPVIKLDKIQAFLEKQDINIESVEGKVDRAYSGELAFSQGDAIIRQGNKVTKCYYIRIWELQENAMWKVSVDMYFAK
ncbi:hypothetical protein GCM10023231_08430 [Olivibacter ginsenosidimutans]|uniref:Nuclear transport factor 2 family protein n=1 Tax=Olivibacter ginsenosidimutans TaxID=1176537 RepID=A0ABP9ALD2_9SPHI